MENIPEMKFDSKIRTEIDDNDYFLKGFLIGYRREKDRINKLRAKKEEKMKKEIEVSMGETVWRRVISEIVVKEVNSKLEDMKPNIEYINDDRIKLKQEIEELKIKLEENKEEKSIEKLNQNELKQESKIEQQVAESLETTMASEVSDISGEEEVEENTQQMVKE